MHWITCIWFTYASYILSEDSSDLNTWIPSNLRINFGSSTNSHNQELINTFYNESDNFDKYSYTLYSMVMVILGSDIGPCTPWQSISCVFICVFGSIFLAVLFGNVSLLLAKINNKYTAYNSRVRELEAKLTQRNIPLYLKNRVLEYLDYCWRKQKIYDELLDFSELSAPLQRECLIYLHKDVIINVPLFSHLESNEILTIIQKLKTEIYMPEDLIIREGELGNQMYFLIEGVVEVIIKAKKKKGGIFLTKGAYFGEIALISQSRRTSSVKAADFCILEVFSKKHYENLKYDFPSKKKTKKST